MAGTLSGRSRTSRCGCSADYQVSGNVQTSLAATRAPVFFFGSVDLWICGSPGVDRNITPMAAPNGGDWCEVAREERRSN